jgi:hypothetical protein
VELVWGGRRIFYRLLRMLQACGLPLSQHTSFEMVMTVAETIAASLKLCSIPAVAELLGSLSLLVVTPPETFVKMTQVRSPTYHQASVQR